MAIGAEQFDASLQIHSRTIVSILNGSDFDGSVLESAHGESETGRISESHILVAA